MQGSFHEAAAAAAAWKAGSTRARCKQMGRGGGGQHRDLLRVRRGESRVLQGARAERSAGAGDEWRKRKQWSQGAN